MYNIDEFHRLLLIGKAWGIAGEIVAHSVFTHKFTVEELLKSLHGENKEKIVERINRMNEGYTDILELFCEIAPHPDAENV